MKFCDINIRDPFILPYNGKYYMYGTRGNNTWERKPLEDLGFDVIPNGTESRHDIIQAVTFHNADAMIAFCEGII